MNAERKLISTHIEKTAGTSVQNLYQTVVGRKNLAIYYARDDKLRRATESVFTNASPFIDWLKLSMTDTPFYESAKELVFWLTSLKAKNEKIEIPNDVMIIHGHFRADRFDAHVDNPLRSIIFRDPLDRMRSQHDHWKRAKGNTEWRINVPYDPNMSFEDYALTPELQNYQTQAVAGKPLGDFNVVGVTENLVQYTDSLLQLFIEQGWYDVNSLTDVSVQTLNQTPSDKRTDQTQLTDTFISQFHKFHVEDYQLYEAACRLVSG